MRRMVIHRSTMSLLHMMLVEEDDEHAMLEECRAFPRQICITNGFGRTALPGSGLASVKIHHVIACQWFTRAYEVLRS